MRVNKQLRFSMQLVVTATIVLNLAFYAETRAATYEESAHGDTGNGVNRSAIASKGYVRGNCSHCHEQHASIDSNEPAPVDGTPSSFALYTENFNTAVTTYPYSESDNICFSCHNESGSIMQVTNYNHAQTFGGYTYTVDPTVTVDSILDAYTPYSGYTHSEHNLKDVYNYANATFLYFTDSSNPCAACHNPHLARRNKTDVDNPTLTAISRPTDHNNLWGDESGETMADSVGANTYQPPYYFGSTTTHEPGGISNHNGSVVPDYNSFCLDCHSNSDVYSSNMGRNLYAIDWSGTGDMHGGSPRYAEQYVAGATLKLPYDTTLGGTSPNYILSCLDCHEPHGTLMQENSFLLRKAINGNRVNGTTSGPGHLKSKEWNWSAYEICIRCHNVGLHCGGDTGCFTCHYHGSIQSAGCTQSWGPHKAF